ncbi:CD63 antigen-like [Ambystoma mexicanum]|uniref:CD63 antigen-like n=1 Tax=Ambystoma mexicanum TaxID=8296 RepID=UPI0037E7F650
MANWVQERANTMATRNKLAITKIGLFFVILFYWATGIALMCLGVLSQMRIYAVNVVLTEGWSGSPMLLTGIGILIFLMSTVGAIAVFRDNHGMIKVFAIMLVIVFVIEIIVGIAAFAFRGKLHKSVIKRFQKIINQYGYDDDITSGVDTLQKSFQCCGAQNSSDWDTSPFRLLKGALPSSCCKGNRAACGTKESENGEASDVFTQGCAKKLKTWIQKHVGFIGAIGVGIGFVQVFGILVASCLVWLMKVNYNVM